MNKRFLAPLVFTVFLLLNLTKISYGMSYVKEIDGDFNNMQIHIQGKKITNHKEPFTYNETIWLPLKDLARGLNLKASMDTRMKRMTLDSGGKLKIEGPNSKEIRSFQRGYEIDALERIAKDLDRISYIDPKAKESQLRTIKLAFGGWDVFLDGKKLDLEPCFYGEDLYVDIMEISPYLYLTPNYKPDKGILDINPNGVLINHPHYNSLDSLLAFREGRNYLLNLQIDQMEERFAFEDRHWGIPYDRIRTLKDLKAYLNKHFSKIGDLKVNIDLQDTIGNWLYLDIDFPRTQTAKWYRLQRLEVENWIWDIYTAILKLYNEESQIHGAIRNPHYSRYSKADQRNYLIFDTKDLDLYFDFSKSLLKKDDRFNPSYLVDNLNSSLKKYEKVGFTYGVNISGDDIELLVYPNSNSPKRWNIYEKMAYLKRLNWEIKRVYPELRINGSLVFPDENLEAFKFYIEDNKIRSYDLLRETEDQLNYAYGSFSHGDHSFDLDFNLYEKDINNLTLLVEGDFSILDEKWTDNEDSLAKRVNTRVQNAISTIISLWDMNVSTEVVDKNGLMITELDIFRDSVGIVYASPGEGEIKEGSLVHLYTDTPGADIYYSLDGSTPTRQSEKYSGPIIVSRDLTINAFGYKEDMGAGPISSFEYRVIADDSWSYGLDNLIISQARLNPSFARDILAYEVNLDGSISSIGISPYANQGDLTINGEKIQSGQEKIFSLAEGRRLVEIKVKEKDKREKTYTISIYRGASGGPEIIMENLQFSTNIIGRFSGKLTSGYISNFNGYKVDLLSKANVPYKTASVNRNGDFQITGFDINPITRIIGYKYRVYDGTGNLILEDEL